MRVRWTRPAIDRLAEIKKSDLKIPSGSDLSIAPYNIAFEGSEDGKKLTVFALETTIFRNSESGLISRRSIWAERDHFTFRTIGARIAPSHRRVQCFHL
jgi:hypothetical protein